MKHVFLFTFLVLFVMTIESRYVPVKSEIQNVRYRNVPYVAKSELRDGGYIVKRSAENPEKKTCSPLRAMRERVLGGCCKNNSCKCPIDCS